MRSSLIVLDHPSLSHLPDIGQALEQVQVQRLSSEAAVESLNEGVLGRLAGLDVVDADIVRLAPAGEGPPQELGAVVDPQRLGQSPRGAQPLEDANRALRSQRGVRLNDQGFPAVVVDDAEHPHLDSASQRIGQEVGRPSVVDSIGRPQRRGIPRGQPPPDQAGQIEPHRPIHPIDALFVPGEALPAKQVAVLAESRLGEGDQEPLQGLYDLPVPL